MRIEALEEGFVFRCEPGTRRASAAGPRTAVTSDGDVICTFAVNSGLGINDFMTMAARSGDAGHTWTLHGSLWPHLVDSYSIFVSVSRAPSGDLYLYGMRFPIDTPGESFWSDATQGMKQNQLIWARSADTGRTWTEPAVIPIPIPGSAEAPGAMCVTRAGRQVVCYAPYNTFDPNLHADKHQVVALTSDDRGKTWRHASMMRFDDPTSNAAEAWVIELADGRLLGSAWHVGPKGKVYANVYALSADGGITWGPTLSTGIMGQATALAPLPDGRALFLYNQRTHGEPGVWLAVVRPTSATFGIE